MTNDRAEAEDVLQSAFIDVFTKLESYRFESSIGAWIKRIVINKCINAMNRRVVRLESLDEQFHGIPAETFPEVDMPDSIRAKDVKQAISALPDGYRLVLSLYLLEGLDHEEISSVLGISVSTSKSQYHRAKRKLKEMLCP